MQESSKLLLLGAGGHCVSVLDTILQLNNYESIGIIDKNVGKKILGVPTIGTDNDLERLFCSGYKHAFITVGSVGNTSIREKLYKRIKEIGFTIPNVIDSSSIVSEYTNLGEGIYIGKNAVLNANVTVGNCVILNSSCIAEHECIIEDFVHLSPGSILCGNVHIKKHTHIGAGSMIKQGVCVGTNTMIGMGSVVLKDIGDDTVAYGNPCKEV